MIKPAKYQDLPNPVLEVILNLCDLDYDPYEGSSDETIAQILRGTGTDINKRIVQTAFDFISDEDLTIITKNCIKDTEETLVKLREFYTKKL